MKKIKIKFVGYEPYMTKNNFVLEILKKHYEIEISEKPDILFYSLFNADHVKYDCIKVYVGGEPCIPDFNECDYAISSVKIECDNRNCYYPFYFLDGLKRFSGIDEGVEKINFCNFIFSHTASRGGLLREEFCKALMQYKMVDCLGKSLHNKDDERLGSRGNPNWRELKLQVLREYKFTIAFENASIAGYTTEKIIDPLQANSIPIYCGNPYISELVNPEAFINANEYIGRFDELIAKIKEVDEDESIFNRMISCPKFRPEILTDFESKIEQFLINIVENGRVFDKDPYHFLDKTRISGYSFKKLSYYKILPYAARYYSRAMRLFEKITGK